MRLACDETHSDIVGDSGLAKERTRTQSNFALSQADKRRGSSENISTHPERATRTLDSDEVHLFVILTALGHLSGG